MYYQKDSDFDQYLNGLILGKHCKNKITQYDSRLMQFLKENGERTYSTKEILDLLKVEQI